MMNYSDFENISPFVRDAKKRITNNLYGRWIDFDNVFTYISEGSAEFILDGVKYIVNKGNAIIMHPYMPHIIYSSTAEPFVEHVVHFDLYSVPDRRNIVPRDPKFINDKVFVENEMCFKNVCPMASIRMFDQQNLVDLLDKILILQKKESKTVFDHLLEKSYMTEIIQIYLYNLERNQSPINSETKGWIYIKNAIRYINKNYADNTLNNQSISEVLNISPNYLSSLFRKEIGISLHRYLIYTRIQKAKQFLTENRLTISEIGYQTGFISIHTFSKTFKQETGLSPSTYIIRKASV